MLEIQDLTMRFGGLNALDGVTFQVKPGQVVGLIGPNGAGKTTVFNLISRFFSPVSGAISFENRDLLRLKPHHIIHFGIVRTFQNLGLFPWMTVVDNLLAGQHLAFRARPLSVALGLHSSRQEERDRTERAQEMLQQMGLAMLQNAITSSLPYGTQKLVELCRALMAQPRLLLLDEPVAGMNPGEKEQMRAFITKIRREWSLTILLVEHDMSTVMELCDWIVVLNFGHVIAQGPPAVVQKDPKVIEAYLGEEVQGVEA